MGQLRLFVASLWLTLATALFCAVVPVGLPHSATHGSAFNPANSVVALHASSSSNRAALKRSAEGDPAPAASAGSDLVAPSHHFLVSAPIAAPDLAPVAALTALPLSNVPEARFPRGPPAA